jgi:Pre ATP-grasp domain
MTARSGANGTLPSIPSRVKTLANLPFALRRPRVRLVAVTCLPVRDEVIDYYLGLMPEAEKARARIELLTPEDASPRPLAEKILERADLMARLRQLVADRRARFVMPFNVRDAERDLALELAHVLPDRTGGRPGA